MLVPSSRMRSIQRALFADPHPRPEWRELSPDVKEKILRLLVLLLRGLSLLLLFRLSLLLLFRRLSLLILFLLPGLSRSGDSEKRKKRCRTNDSNLFHGVTSIASTCVPIIGQIGRLDYQACTGFQFVAC